jgi:uncharacterized protein YodC (DUF2158 family)
MHLIQKTKKRSVARNTTIVLVAIMLGAAVTDAPAAGQGGGGRGLVGTHIIGTTLNPGLPSLNGVPNGNARSAPLINFLPTPALSSPPGSIPGTLPAHQSFQANPTQQGTSQSLGFLGNYPGVAKNGPASIAYSGGYAYAGRISMRGTPVSLSDDQKARLNNSASPQSVSSQQAHSQGGDNGIDLKVGTRVRLRAGSPMMVVTSSHGSEVTCVWFNSFGQAESGTFPAASLM